MHDEDLMISRKLHSTEADEFGDASKSSSATHETAQDRDLMERLDQRMRHSFPKFGEQSWTLGDVARWIIERTPEAVDGVSVDEERLREVLPDMQSTFARGDISVLGCTKNNPTPKELPSETWSVYELIIEEKNGLIRVLPSNSSSAELDDELFGIRLRRSEVLREWPDPSVRSEPTQPTTIGAERQCQRWLGDLMKESPPQTKAKVYSEALLKFPNLAARAFDRGWAAASSEAGNEAWRAPGRRRAQIKSPH
jgi:hypothetical protein